MCFRHRPETYSIHSPAPQKNARGTATRGAVEVTFDHAGEVLWTEFPKTEAEGGCLNALRWRLERRWEGLWGR